MRLSPRASKLTSPELNHLRLRIRAPQPHPYKKILSPSASSALSKRVLRLTTKFVPTAPNFLPRRPEHIN